MPQRVFSGLFDSDDPSPKGDPSKGHVFASRANPKTEALLLQLAGVPVAREGNVITLQSNLVFSFESGIRSFLTPLTVAIIGLATGAGLLRDSLG
jgi:hypothetical protein